MRRNCINAYTMILFVPGNGTRGNVPCVAHFRARQFARQQGFTILPLPGWSATGTILHNSRSAPAILHAYLFQECPFVDDDHLVEAKHGKDAVGYEYGGFVAECMVKVIDDLVFRFASTALRQSSKIITSGSFIRALAMEILCFCPPLSVTPSPHHCIVTVFQCEYFPMYGGIRGSLLDVVPARLLV